MYLYIEVGPLSPAPAFLTDGQPLTINKHLKTAFVRWVTHKTKRVGWRGCFWKRRTIILTTMMASARVAVHSKVMQNYFKAPPTPHPRWNIAVAADWTTTPTRESNDWRSALHHRHEATWPWLLTGQSALFQVVILCMALSIAWTGLHQFAL